MNYHFIDPDKITDMLFGDGEPVVEFCEAGTASITEFIENYHTYLLDRNMEDLRKAGHKIKPGAQMMGAHEVVEEYENAKSLLRAEADQKKLEKSVEKMEEICSGIQNELSQLTQEHN